MTQIKISREAAIEALGRAGHDQSESMIKSIIDSSTKYQTTYQLASAIQELWDNVPSKRPVDKRLEAVRAGFNAIYPCLMKKDEILFIAAYDAKMAEFERQEVT